MFGDHGWNHSSPDAFHHFYLAYGNNKEILDHYTNKLNQDLELIIVGGQRKTFQIFEISFLIGIGVNDLIIIPFP